MSVEGAKRVKLSEDPDPDLWSRLSRDQFREVSFLQISLPGPSPVSSGRRCPLADSVALGEWISKLAASQNGPVPRPQRGARLRGVQDDSHCASLFTQQLSFQVRLIAGVADKTSPYGGVVDGTGSPCTRIHIGAPNSAIYEDEEEDQQLVFTSVPFSHYRDP